MCHFHCGPRGLGGCCLCRRGLSWLLGLLHLQLGPHYAWQRSAKAGRGRDEREGGRRLAVQRRDFSSSSWYHGWINWCCFVHFLCWPSEKGEEKYSASCLWHGSWSLSLAHSVTIIPSYVHATCYCNRTRTGKLVHTHPHTHIHHPLPLKCICRSWSYGIGLCARY